MIIEKAIVVKNAVVVATSVLLISVALSGAQSNESAEGYKNWESLWQERVEALESILGAHEDVYPATLPLYLGGTSDIISF
ncbi:MAG: hypothetical protein GF401_10280, partial [Chitinivibrionales bacterium]|nr:hypothetical protein [Chitinivibrionales bacterium]